MEQRGAWRPSALTLDGDDEGQQCQLQGAVHLAARQRPRKTSALPESRLRCLCRTHMASDDRPAPRPAARDPGRSGSCSAGRGLSWPWALDSLSTCTRWAGLGTPLAGAWA